MAAPSSTAKETPEQTMARVKSELAASGEATGQQRQAQIEQQAGIGRSPVTSATAQTPAEKISSGQPSTAAGKFVDVVRQKAAQQVATKRDALLKAPQNYDTQIELQRGALYTALADQAVALTPENLRWLTPDQQAAIRSGDKKVIGSAIIGLNSILQSRKDDRAEQEAKQRQDQQDAISKFQVLQQMGALDQVDPQTSTQIESALGLQPGKLAEMAAKQGTSTFQYQQLGGNTIEQEFDRNTGKLLNSRVVASFDTGDGTISEKDKLEQAQNLVDNGTASDMNQAYQMVNELVTNGKISDATMGSTSNPLSVTIGDEIRTGGTPAWRNNNPGNIKYSHDDGSLTQFATNLLNQGIQIQAGSKATDGGNFIAFPDIQSGTRAMSQLLFGDSYSSLTTDEALKKWSASGYGSEILPEDLRNKKISDLTSTEQQTVLNAMMNREGFQAGTVQTKDQAFQDQINNSQYSDFLQGRSSDQVQNFLSLSSLDQSNVKQLISGEALLSDLMSSRGVEGSKMRQKLLQEAQSIEPGFSENTNKIRYDFLKKWNAPDSQVGKNRISINTAIGHLADLAVAADALDPTTLQDMNSVKNVLNKKFGDPEVTNFRIALNAVGSELAAVFKGGSSAPTETEIEEWTNSLADSFSQSQFDGAFDTAAHLLSSRISSLRYSYNLTMGQEYDQNVIDPEKYQALVDAGIDPSSIVSEKLPGVTTKDNGNGIDLSGTRTVLQNRKSADGQTLSSSDVDLLMNKIQQFVAQGNTEEEITNWINSALGF